MVGISVGRPEDWVAVDSVTAIEFWLRVGSASCSIASVVAWMGANLNSGVLVVDRGEPIGNGTGVTATPHAATNKLNDSKTKTPERYFTFAHSLCAMKKIFECPNLL